MRPLIVALLALAVVYIVMGIPRSPSSSFQGVGFPANPAELRVSQPNLKLVLEKDQNTWQVRAPVRDQADQQVVQTFLSSLNLNCKLDCYKFL